MSAALLTGGASTRMGSDKSHLELDGRSLGERAALLLSRLFEDVMIVGGAPPEPAPGRRIEDAAGPRCALRGVVAALEAARAERVILLATDLPGIDAGLLLALTTWPETDAVVPRDEKGAHPLCAIYRRESVLPVARERLVSEKLSLHGLLDAIDTDWIEGDALRSLDPRGELLRNVNTPAEFAAIGGAPPEPA